MSRCPQVTFASAFVCGVLLTASLVAGITNEKVGDEACDINAGVNRAACNGLRPGDTKDVAGFVETDPQKVQQQTLEEQEERHAEKLNAEHQRAEGQHAEGQQEDQEHRGEQQGGEQQGGEQQDDEQQGDEQQGDEQQDEEQQDGAAPDGQKKCVSCNYKGLDTKTNQYKWMSRCNNCHMGCCKSVEDAMPKEFLAAIAKGSGINNVGTQDLLHAMGQHMKAKAWLAAVSKHVEVKSRCPNSCCCTEAVNGKCSMPCPPNHKECTIGMIELPAGDTVCCTSVCGGKFSTPWNTDTKEDGKKRPCPKACQ